MSGNTWQYGFNDRYTGLSVLVKELIMACKKGSLYSPTTPRSGIFSSRQDFYYRFKKEIYPGINIYGYDIGKGGSYSVDAASVEA